MVKITSRARSLRAVGEMLFATAIWGFGFTATVWALESFSPFAVSFWRFGAAFVLAIPLVYFSRDFLSEFNWTSFKLAFTPGILIGSVLILQTWGLEMTTATKSGFITTLYVVFVPLIEVFLAKKRLHRMHFLWVFLALVGTAFMVNMYEYGLRGLNMGDALTLACAVFAAFHIVVVGKVSRQVKSAFIFNAFQSFWSAALSLVIVLITSGPHWKGMNGMAMVGLVSLAIGSTMIAFALQVKAQKTLSPSLSSLLFLLESPFAMLFGIALLGESLTWSQGLGAVLIFTSAFGAVYYEKHIKP